MQMPALSRYVLAGLLAASPLPGHAGAACRMVKLAELPLHEAGPGRQPVLATTINGQTLTMLFDTGATHTFLHRRGSEQLGLRIQKNGGLARGSGGQTRIATAHVTSFAIGPAEVRDFYMRVLDESSASPGIGGMLGVDLSLHDDLEIDLPHAVLRTFRPEGCATTALGYWSDDVLQTRLLVNPRHAGDRRPFVEVQINGHKAAALVNSSASVSRVRLGFARQTGFDEAGATVLGMARGIDGERTRVWAGHFQFKLGDEDIAHAPLQVMEEQSGGFDIPDVVLGQDWLRAHRVLIAPSQDVFYFSYEGGQPFGTGQR